jgi:DNA-binding MarR family transcriptional regulator
MSRGNQALRADLGDEARALQSAVDALDEVVAAHLGVNRTDLRCLDILLQLGSATPGKLATALGLTTGSVTTMLDRLEKLGHLRRSSDPADRRKVLVTPSDSVLRIAAELYGPLAEEGAREVARYTTAELELLIDFHRRSRLLQERHADRIRRLRDPQRAETSDTGDAPASRTVNRRMG